MKNNIYKLVEKGSHGSKINVVFDVFIMILILLNLFAIILESVDKLYIPYKSFFYAFEIFTVVIFSLEFIMRIVVSDMTNPGKNKFHSAVKFIFSPLGLIDLLAILPFYLPFLFVVDLRFIRIIRLVRFFRILKINRYTNSLKVIVNVFKEKKSDLGVTLFAILLLLVISSILMFYIENPEQPDAFPNILASFWWAIATLTTVGYGDIYPITEIGKLISGIIMILGIGVVALPTGILSAGFLSKLNESKKEKEEDRKCPHCGKDI